MKRRLLLFVAVGVSVLALPEAAHAGYLQAWGSDSHGMCDMSPGDDFVAITSGSLGIDVPEPSTLVEVLTSCVMGLLVGRPRVRRTTLVLLLFLVLGVIPARTSQAGTIRVWGDNKAPIPGGGVISADGTCHAPPGDDFVAVADSMSPVALREDRSLLAWNLETGDTRTPVEGNQFTALAGGDGHVLALRANGSIAAWGMNHAGQCNVPSGKRFITIGAGVAHSLAVEADGSLVAWGSNRHGQCDVPPGNDFVAVAGGLSSSAALRADGALVAWGLWSQQRPLPAGSDFVAMALGDWHGLALRDGGSLAAWGSNFYGECDVPEGHDFVAIAAGLSHSLALRQDGSLVAWGGRSGTGQYDVPAGNRFVAIAAGVDTSYAIEVPEPSALVGILSFAVVGVLIMCDRGLHHAHGRQPCRSGTPCA